MGESCARASGLMCQAVQLSGNRNRYIGRSGADRLDTGSVILMPTGDRDGGGDIRGAVHSHLSAAQWQLLQALRLYEEGQDYYSVITLAGAAEEIFGRLSQKMGLGCSLDRLKATLPKLSERFFQQELEPREAAKSVNRAKNWLKHGEDPLSFDAKFEAEEMLERAIQNCFPIISSSVNESSEELTSNLVDAISRYDERKFAARSGGKET